MNRYFIGLIAVISLFLALGCGGSDDTVTQQVPPPGQTVAGVWQGELGRAIGDKFDVQFNLSGTVIQGAVRVIEANGTVRNGNITNGSIVGHTISATANMGAFGTITFQGTWDGSNSINGRYSRTLNNQLVENNVVLNLTRGSGTVTVNGSWSGTYTVTQGGEGVGTWSATFTQNGNRLTVTNATINGQQATVLEATIIGDRITFGSGTQQGVTFNWNATVAPNASSMNGNFSTNTGLAGTFQGNRQ
ncbi:MAG TPA: hypothetical protein VEX38_08005 [Fimbriimonadaceae bacterium]|nr:hypothetical protein [Fimbriimonadaceae bacterium]